MIAPSEGVAHGRRCSNRKPPAAAKAIEATLNYIVNNGEKFSPSRRARVNDVRSGGTPDPHRVTIRNGRPMSNDFALERDGFRFVHARHQGAATSSIEDEVRRVYYPEMEALMKAESGAKRVVVFDHTLRTADDEFREAHEDPRGRAPRAQRLHRMVGPAARARPAARRGRRSAAAAASPSSRCGGRSAIRSRSFPLAICDARSSVASTTS